MAPLRVQARVARRGPTGAFALDVNLELGPGITCAMGPSGAGKSTLLGVIAGLVTPDEGRVALGEEVWLDTARRIRVPVHKRHVAYLFQSLALFPHLSAIHNVEYSLPRRTPRAERHARAHALLTRVGVDHLAQRRPRTFSGGEAQRVALARALAMAPRVILLDEPFSALDRELKIPLIALVRELALEAGVPTVAVAHSVGEARALADRVIRIAAGRITADGDRDALLPARERHHVDDRALDVTPAPVRTGALTGTRVASLVTMPEQPKPQPDERPKPTEVPPDHVEPSKDRPSGPGDTGPGSTADRKVTEEKDRKPS